MKNKSILFLFIALMAESGQIYAQDGGGVSQGNFDNRDSYRRSEKQPHLGITAGAINSNETDSTLSEFGLDIGFQPIVPISLGLEAGTSRQADSSGIESDRTSVLAKASYNFAGNTPVIRNSFAGVAAGTILRDNRTGFAAGPLVGFDIPLSNRAESSPLSLGASAKYLFTDTDEPESLSVNGVLKYWF